MEPPQGNGEDELKWESLEWPDGSIYEGLTRQGKLHRNGILQFPTLDRYEGEFEDGKPQGYGVYVWQDGTVYRGEWRAGMMHGCGVRLWRSAPPPGQGSPAAAAAAAAAAGGSPRRGPAGAGEPEEEDPGFNVQEGKFFADQWVGPVMSCSEELARAAAVEADVASRMARAFITEQGLSKRRHLVQRVRAGQPAAVPAQSIGSGSGGSSGGTQGQRGSPSSTSLPGAQQGQGSKQAGFKWPWEGGWQWPFQQQQRQQQAGSSEAGAQGMYPPGHPANDPDVGMRTRKLSEAERSKVAGLVDVLMMKEAQAVMQERARAGAEPPPHGAQGGPR